MQTKKRDLYSAIAVTIDKVFAASQHRLTTTSTMRINGQEKLVDIVKVQG